MRKNKGKISIKRISIAFFSLAMVAGFIFLFISASNNKKEGDCTGIVISLKKGEKAVYVDTAHVRKQLLAHEELNPVGKPLAVVNIPLLERLVEKEAWIKSTEIYLGNHNLLHVKIEQKKPVARVFTKSGNSFFLDESGEKIPAKGQFTIKLPVFTGFPKSTKAHKDSILLEQIKDMSRFIEQNKFWNAQVDQVKISAEDGFEIIPRVGDVLIVFGEGKKIKEKFDKLMIFYKEGLNKVGWGYYDTLDLRFEGQVVAGRKKKEGNPVIETLVRHNDPANEKAAGQNIANRE